jgi:Asp/Glu/hydantoin racemase
MINNCIEVIEQEKINVFVFGCTGMSYIAEELRKNLKTKGYKAIVIEPLEAGVKYIEYLVELGLTNTLPYKINMDSLNWK